MREIKYRAWDKAEKQMFQDVDVLRNGAVIWFEIDEYGEQPVHWFNNYGENYVSEFDTMVVMQFVGIRDKNGKEIYEGDILKDENGLGEVKWVQEHCAFVVLSREPSQYHFLESDGHLRESEVVGNIYENPDLLSA